MTVDYAVELSRAAIMLTLLIGAPLVLCGLLVGLVVSVLQAVTQIQDQTITFVPKIVVMLLTLLYLLPWVMTELMEYSTNLIRDIPGTL